MHPKLFYCFENQKENTNVLRSEFKNVISSPQKKNSKRYQICIDLKLESDVKY